MWAMGQATNLCDIYVTYMYRGFGPVVITWSDQAGLLWEGSSSFQHIWYSTGLKSQNTHLTLCQMTAKPDH